MAAWWVNQKVYWDQILKNIMMHVISSMELSYSYQRLIASLMIASAAFSAELFR